MGAESDTWDVRAVGALLLSLGTESIKFLVKGVVEPSVTLRVIETWLMPSKRAVY